MASELKVDKITGVTTAGSIDVTGEGNSTTTNLQQGLAKAWGILLVLEHLMLMIVLMSSLDDNRCNWKFDANFTNNMANSNYASSKYGCWIYSK